MKKLISSILLFTMLLTNVVYSMPNYGDSFKINVIQSISSNVETIQSVTVNNFNDLKQYKDISDITIDINSNITLEEKIEITGGNVIINGNGFEIDINESKTKLENRFVIKGNNVSINNISIKNYITSGILLYNAKDIVLSDINIFGNKTNIADDKSKVGIDLTNSTAILENIKSENHRYSGIRLRNQSEITLNGGNIHNSDVSDIESQVVDGADENKIVDSNNIYTKWQDKVNNGVTSTIYKLKTISTVNNLEEFKEAIKISNSIIILNNNIILDTDIEINQKNIIINGNGKEISLSNKFNLRVKSASDIEINDFIIKDYKSTGLTIYSSNNIKLSNIQFIGNDLSLDKSERSTVGLDIYNSTVQLSHIQTKNHLYRGIQVRNGSTVEILTVNIHDNDSVHMQSIVAAGENENTISYTSGTYLPGNKYLEGTNQKIDYYSQKNISINSISELKNNIKNSGNVITLESDLKVEQTDLDEGSNTLELELASSVVINGNGKVIDFNNLGNITLKGKDIRLINVTIKNSNNHAINIYNSKNALLDNVKVENSARTGIFVNGSSVKLQNCITMNNTEGGIAITRSRTLLGSGYSDSYVEVVGTIIHEESNINVNVKNLEMTDGYIQDNKFIFPDGIYDKYVNDKAYKALSDYYLDHFNIQGEDRKKKYQEQDIDYMIIKKVIDVTKNTEILDESSNPIQLVGDGVTDETEKIEKLIEYAASHGIELYFPKGTYKITRDIDLSKINLPALSNFKISGDKEGLSIFDATSNTEKMLKLVHAEYKGPMNYIEIENIVFNNMGIEINGPYKKGITIKNNTFMNGNYTREKREDGSISKATMEPYVIAKNTKYTIENNIFLRGQNYPGRGISTYRTKNTSIINNFFGDLEDADDAAKMLPTEVVNRLSIIKNSNLIEGHQGNFFTAINNERYDTNVLIANNYFSMMKTRNIVSDFEEDVLVSGINVAKEGQRRDHIIYSKSYDTLNIVGNYFKGMENGAAGGVKIRNGSNVYVGSNYFDDVPLLTYIYGDLTREDSILYDTVIYNNLFHAKTNFGGEGTGILYYQSFRDGDTLSFSIKNSDGTVAKDVWENAYGDVKNFIIYKNSFLSDERDQITISGRAQTAYKNNEFLSYGNTYMESDNPVNYNTKGNLGIPEVTEQLILSKINAGYNTYKDIEIPLTPAEVDYTYLIEAIVEADAFYKEIFNDNLIGNLFGQYSQSISNELKQHLEEKNNFVNLGIWNQSETNKAITLIKELLEKLKNSINTIGDAPVVSNITDIEINKGDIVDFMKGIIITDDRDTIDDLDIKIDLGDFNNLISGTYIIKYVVTDRDGNVTKFTRNIVVLEEVIVIPPESNDGSGDDNESNDDMTNDNESGDNIPDDESNDDTTNDDESSDDTTNDNESNDDTTNNDESNDDTTDDNESNDDTTDDNESNDDTTNNDDSNDDTTDDNESNDDTTDDNESNDNTTNNSESDDDISDDNIIDNNYFNDNLINNNESNSNITNNNGSNNHVINNNESVDNTVNNYVLNDIIPNDNNIIQEDYIDEIMNEKDYDNNLSIMLTGFIKNPFMWLIILFLLLFIFKRKKKDEEVAN